MDKHIKNPHLFKQGHIPWNKGKALGLLETSFYRIWKNMKRRCHNENDISYPRYGGRGIKVCEKWLIFAGFYEDMYFSYKDGLSINRLNNNGDYCKENCVWATQIEQQNNRSDNHFITYKGITDTLSNWARFVGLKKTTLHSRLNYFG